MRIRKCEFLLSVANSDKLPEYDAPEIAIAGRSNVGKSTLINYLVNNKKMAKTSSTPGRTRLLNYFKLNDGEFNIVDLPGYGYAKASKSEQAKWGKMIEGYFKNSEKLKNVFVLVDIRHKPTEDDILLVNYFYYYNIPFTIVATKADKLSKQVIAKSKKLISETFNVGLDDIIVTSASKKTGKEKILDRIETILELKADS